MGQINIVELWNSMGGIAKGVVVLLFILSAYSISVMVERWLTYRQARKQSRVRRFIHLEVEHSLPGQGRHRQGM